MRTRPLCFVCLLFMMIQGILLMAKSGESYAKIPASSIFYEGEEKSVRIQGQVYKKTNTSNIQILYLKNNSTDDSRLLIYDSDFTNVSIGQTITLQGKLQFFEGERNPGNFDRALFYARQKIYGVIWCENVIEVSGRTNVLMESLYQLRTKWKNTLIECMGERNGGILAAVILGEKGEMDSEIKELYQNNGISHILAISGLHISFIGLGIYKLIRKTGLGFLPSGILATGILTLYILMIGFSVSAVRAYFMLLLKIGADITGRVYDMLTAAMLGAALTIAYQPLYLTDAGFYMSYGAIFGICLILPMLQQSFACKWKWLSGCYASMAINIMLFPLTLWFYFVFPTYSFLWNMLVLPLMSPLLGFGILGSILTLCFGEVGEIILKICGWMLELIEFVCKVGNRFPMGRLVLGKPALWKVFFYYAVLLIILVLIRKDIRRRRAGWLLLGGAIFILSYQPRNFLTITMLDVGQGDGIFMQGPRGETYFIDGGSSDVSEVGKYRIEPFLESQGVSELDYVFVTHGDKDHYSGVEEMLENREYGIEIERLVLPVNYQEDDMLLQLAKNAQDKGVEVLLIDEGQCITEGEMIITCIQPSKEDYKLEGNAGSLVLDVEYGEFSMLFTGDVEHEGEERLISRMKGKDYDVLKVSHHGSKYSTSEKFLQEISPEIALISSGENNSYGHPHKELLERLTDAGVKVYNTQKNGAITLRTQGNSLTIW